MKDLMIVVPSRGRPKNIARLDEAIHETVVTDHTLIVCLDDDDEPKYPVLNGVSYMMGPRRTFPDWLNKACAEYAHEYQYVALFGDDVVPTTPGWDLTLIDALGGFGVAYGDDGIQHEALPTHPVIPTSWFCALGWIALPGQHHLYLDNVWKALGEGTGSLKYMREVKLPHLHRNLGLAPDDETYRRANDSPEAHADASRFEAWRYGSGYVNAIETLKRLQP